MKVSHRGLYALKALVHLASAYERGLVKIHEIAETEEIPEKFLEGILVTLKNARIVASQRGREGGYRLRRPPQLTHLSGRTMSLLPGATVLETLRANGIPHLIAISGFPG